MVSNETVQSAHHYHKQSWSNFDFFEIVFCFQDCDIPFACNQISKSQTSKN